MKRSLWKALLSVALLLTMLVSMLPFAAFAENGQTAATPTEESAKAGDVPKAGSTSKTGDKTAGAAETRDVPKDDAAMDESKDTPKDDAAKDESKDSLKGDAVKGDVKDAPKGGAEDASAQVKTLESNDTPESDSVPMELFLTYEANGGNGGPDRDGPYIVNVGSKYSFKIKSLAETTITAPDGYTFNGWNTQADGQGEAVAVGSDWAAEYSATLYAQWVEDKISITLTYDANGGTGSDSETKKFNIGEPYTFTVKSRSDTGIDRAKHSFLYWSDDKDGNGSRYNGGNEITVTGDTTLYAQWQYVPQKINILYYPNTDLGVPEVDRGITEGTSYTVRSNTFRPPYNKHFVNWNTASDGSGTPYGAGQVITAPDTDLILVAQWADDPKWSELGIAISAPAKALPGADLTYAITVTNGTGYDLNSVVVDVALPAEVTYDESLSSCGAWSLSYDPAARVVTARLESADGSPVLALDGTSEFNLPVTITPAVFGTIEAKAKIASAFSRTGRGETGEGNSAAAQTTMSGLEISVNAAPQDPALGETITYKVTVINNTGLTLSGIRINNGMNSYDSLSMLRLQYSSSDGWNFVSTSEGNLCDFHKDLADGASSSYELTTSFINADNKTAACTATITSVSADGRDPVNGDFGSDSATATLKELDWSGLTISVTPSAPFANMYGQFSYTVTVTNNTGVTLKEVNVTDNLPTDVPPLSAHKDENVRLSFDAQSIAWAKTVYAKISNLADGQSASFTVTVQFRYSSTTAAVNRASITSAVTADDRTMTNGLPSAEATVCLLSGLTISKTVDKDTAKPGDTLIYTVEVSNGTAVDLTKLSVDDLLPAGVTYDPKNSDPGDWSFDTAAAPDTVKATLSNGLASGGKAAFKIAATVNAGVSGTVTNTAKITEAANAYGSSSVDKSASAETEVLVKVPVNVTVLFNGLKDVSQVPAGYKLTGAEGNTFLKGDLTLDPAESKTGHIFRKLSTEEYVRLGQEYSLSFTQSDYDIPGYICTLTTVTDPIRVTAQDAIAGINVDITLSYVKENLFTYPSVTVRTYFKGLTKLPDSFGYKLNCISAPEEAIAFQGPLTLTPGIENGVPYLEFSAADVTLQAGTELTFSFDQSGYDIPGCICALGNSTFKFTLPLPAADVRQPIMLKIENTYTQPDWSKLTITKAADKTYATPGSTVKYTVTVTNNTGVDLSNITVADKLDSKLRYSDSTGDYSAGTGTWTAASLADGKSVSFTLTVKLKSGLAAGTVIENTASVTGATAAGLAYDLSGQKLFGSVSVTVTSGKSSPRTGDESNLGLWIAVMAASLACAGAAAVIYKKRRG